MRVEIALLKEVEPHPNADRLSTGLVNGHQVVFPTVDHAEGDLVVHIPSDAMVPVGRQDFSWLHATHTAGYHRVRNKKVRGITSSGFIIRTPQLPENVGHVCWIPGDDVQDVLGVKEWKPKAHSVMLPPAPVKDYRLLWLAVTAAAVGFAFLPLWGGALLTVLAIVMVEFLIERGWGYR